MSRERDDPSTRQLFQPGAPAPTFVASVKRAREEYDDDDRGWDAYPSRSEGEDYGGGGSSKRAAVEQRDGRRGPEPGEAPREQVYAVTLLIPNNTMGLLIGKVGRAPRLVVVITRIFDKIH